MKVLKDLNTLILEYNALATSIGVVILLVFLTLVATHIANKSAEKRQIFEADRHRRLKLSEFRQVWINDLRNDLSQFISICAYQKDSEEEEIKKMIFLIAKIQIMMNADDPNFSKLVDCMKNLSKPKLDDTPTTENDALPSELIKLSRTILKEEWKRLKKELGDMSKS